MCFSASLGAVVTILAELSPGGHILDSSSEDTVLPAQPTVTDNDKT